jgi:hypothetical protein
MARPTENSAAAAFDGGLKLDAVECVDQQEVQRNGFSGAPSRGAQPAVQTTSNDPSPQQQIAAEPSVRGQLDRHRSI